MALEQRFYVELTEGETTVVSWKKLVSNAKREMELEMSSNSNALANSNSTLATQIALAPIAPHQVPNRLTAVIERIERMFQGEDSDDDNVDDGHVEDCYDTDDSFIDDEELDKYFVKEKIKTKHSGFFINRGALERINIEPSPLIEVVQHAVKKKRAESKKNKASVVGLSLEARVLKEWKRKEPRMRKKREPKESKKNLVHKLEQEQGTCQSLDIGVGEPKKRKRKEPTGMLKEPKRNKRNAVQEREQEPFQDLEIEDKK